MINQWRGMELPCSGDNGIPLPDNVTVPCPFDEFPDLGDQYCDPSGNLTIPLPENATIPVCIFQNAQDIFDFYGYKEVNGIFIYVSFSYFIGIYLFTEQLCLRHHHAGCPRCCSQSHRIVGTLAENEEEVVVNGPF